MKIVIPCNLKDPLDVIFNILIFRMSVSFNLKGSEWAAKQQQSSQGDAAEFWSKLELYSKKKLWHQLTQVVFWNQVSLKLKLSNSKGFLS